MSAAIAARWSLAVSQVAAWQSLALLALCSAVVVLACFFAIARVPWYLERSRNFLRCTGVGGVLLGWVVCVGPVCVSPLPTVYVDFKV